MTENDLYAEEAEYEDQTENEKELLKFVMAHVEPWKRHRVTEYDPKWEEYERLWRGIWTSEDKVRDSERSRFIAPTLQRAIEARLAEQEQAIFGKNSFFDISDDWQDQERTDIEALHRNLQEDFRRDGVESVLSECMLIAEVTGTGIAEIVVDETVLFKPATRPSATPGLKLVGRESKKRFAVKPVAVHPKNFVIDPAVDNIQDSLGIAVERYVPLYNVVQDMSNGVYKKCSLESAQELDENETYYRESDPNIDTVLVTRWYGLVPAKLLEPEAPTMPEQPDMEGLYYNEEQEQGNSKTFYDLQEQYEDMVEAIVIIANESKVLKAVKSPYMMADRPVVAYRVDVVPGRFWGRGTAEKAYNMQKAIDGQIRMHLDSAALTAAPMLAMDSTKMPRGAKFRVQPGLTITTNGPPNEVFREFKFGQTDPVSVQTAQLFEQMLQQAAGTMSGIPQQAQQPNGQPNPQVSEASLRSNRTLMNLQHQFIIPLVTKTAWRYMQFDPQRYPAKDYTFVPVATLGMIQREYEQFKLLGVLQTLGPQSPIVPLLLQSIISTSNLQNREELVATLKKLMEPDPQKQQMEQEMAMIARQSAVAQLEKTMAEAEGAKADAMKKMAEAQSIPIEARAKIIAALSNNLDEDQESKDFKQRLEIVDRVLEERKIMNQEKDIDSNERIAVLQMQTSREDKMQERELKSVFEKFNERLDDILNAEDEVIRDDKNRIVGKRKKVKPRKEPANVTDIATKVSKLN